MALYDVWDALVVVNSAWIGYKVHFQMLCFSFTLSGLLLWLMCAVCFLGPGAVQPSLLSDTTGSLGNASSSLAVPAGVEGRHAGRQGDLPHVLCQGFQLVGLWSSR